MNDFSVLFLPYLYRCMHLNLNLYVFGMFQTG